MKRTQRTWIQPNRATLAVLALSFLGMAGSARAQINLTDPDGIAVGTEYQLIFVTSTTTTGGTPNEVPYNNFVQSLVASTPALAALDATWTAITSINGVSAVSNASSSGSVYNLNGNLVADAANGLYSGSILSAVDYTQTGALLTGVDVWTGSTPEGFPSVNSGTGVGQMVGACNGSLECPVEYGVDSDTDGSWLASSQSAYTTEDHIYAVSGVMTATPEPSTVWMLLGGGVMMGLGSLRRRAARNQQN